MDINEHKRKHKKADAKTVLEALTGLAVGAFEAVNG